MNIYKHWLEAEDKTAFVAEGLSTLNAEQQVIFLTTLYNEFSAARREAYDKLNQFELQYDDTMYGTTSWIDAISAIKARLPKPEEIN